MVVAGKAEKRGRDPLLAALEQDLAEIEIKAGTELTALVEEFRNKGVNIALPAKGTPISVTEALSQYRQAWRTYIPLLDAGLASSEEIEGIVNTPNFFYGNNFFIYQNKEKGFILDVKTMSPEIRFKIFMKHDSRNDVRELKDASARVIESISPEIYDIYSRCRFPTAMDDALERNIKKEKLTLN